MCILNGCTVYKHIVRAMLFSALTCCKELAVLVVLGCIDYKFTYIISLFNTARVLRKARSF